APESEDVVRAIRADGGTAVYIPADVADAGSVRAMVGEVVAWGGGLDIAVNNAGASGRMVDLADLTDEDYDTVVDVNLRGLFHCLRAEILAMRGHGGSIVNVLSTAAHRSYPKASVYGASKRAGLALTESAAIEEIGNGIRINAVSPGGTETAMMHGLRTADPELYKTMVAMMPTGRFADPHEQAQVIAFFCGPESAFISAAALKVDLGQTLR
ncbi:SDR family NAD(P)-dependent oxidoreductase, partial [Actinocorallia lasiicapitis]